MQKATGEKANVEGKRGSRGGQMNSNPPCILVDFRLYSAREVGASFSALDSLWIRWLPPILNAALGAARIARWVTTA